MISYKIKYSPSAFADIDGIYEYISVELKAEQAAKNQVGNIRNKIRSLDIMPERFSIVDWEP